MGDVSTQVGLAIHGHALEPSRVIADAGAAVSAHGDEVRVGVDVRRARTSPGRTGNAGARQTRFIDDIEPSARLGGGAATRRGSGSRNRCGSSKNSEKLAHPLHKRVCNGTLVSVMTNRSVKRKCLFHRAL